MVCHKAVGQYDCKIAVFLYNLHLMNPSIVKCLKVYATIAKIKLVLLIRCG